MAIRCVALRLVTRSTYTAVRLSAPNLVLRAFSPFYSPLGSPVRPNPPLLAAACSRKFPRRRVPLVRSRVWNFLRSPQQLSQTVRAPLSFRWIRVLSVSMFCLKCAVLLVDYQLS